MGVKTFKCHTKSTPRSTPFISAIYLAIEQESDFQPQNDVLKFPLISFAIAHFNHHSLLFQIWFGICTTDHMLRVIMPLITWPQSAQYKMYGEICYIGLVLAILMGQNFLLLVSLWLAVSCSAHIILRK